MSYPRTTWREELIEALELRDECWDDIQSITLADEELDKEFDASYGGTEGKPFTAWTANTVYFPACYDGAEWVAWVSRNPNGKATEHVGGG